MSEGERWRERMKGRERVIKREGVPWTEYREIGCEEGRDER